MKTIEELEKELKSHNNKIQEINKRYKDIEIEKKNAIAIAEDIFVQYLIQKIKGVHFDMFSNDSCECILQCSFNKRKYKNNDGPFLEDFFSFIDCFSINGHGFNDSSFSFTHKPLNKRKQKIDGKWVEIPLEPYERQTLIEGVFEWQDSYLYIRKPYDMSIRDFIDWTKSIGIVIENRDYNAQKDRLNKQIEKLKSELSALEQSESDFKEKIG